MNLYYAFINLIFCFFYNFVNTKYGIPIQSNQIVLRIFKQFLKVSDSSRNSQIVLGIFKQFSEVSDSSRNSQTVLRSLKQFSEFLNSSQNSQTVGGLKNCWYF